MTTMKRILALVMSIMMFISSTPVSAMADGMVTTGTVTTTFSVPVTVSTENVLVGGETIDIAVGQTKNFYIYAAQAPSAQGGSYIKVEVSSADGSTDKTESLSLIHI